MCRCNEPGKYTWISWRRMAKRTCLGDYMTSTMCFLGIAYTTCTMFKLSVVALFHHWKNTLLSILIFLSRDSIHHDKINRLLICNTRVKIHKCHRTFIWISHLSQSSAYCPSTHENRPVRTFIYHSSVERDYEAPICLDEYTLQIARRLPHIS